MDCNDTITVAKETIAKEVLDYYLGPDEKINTINFKKFSQIFTDRLFVASAEQSARLQAKVTNSPVYYFIFNYTEGENSLAQFYTNTPEVEGASHGDDGIYFYGIGRFKPLSVQDKRLVTACQDMLYSYATSGYPSFDGTDTWQPTGSEELTYLIVNGPDNMKLQRSKNLTPIDFWSKLGLLENENLIKDEL
nr:carboxylesterase [Pharsalia antennata]